MCYSKELSNTMQTYPYLEVGSGSYPQHFLQLSWTLKVHNKISQNHITRTYTETPKANQRPHSHLY